MSLYMANRAPSHPNIPDVALHDPANRRMKVICVGAGVCGILDAYNIQTKTENVELTIYEKNSDIGGTWFENRYPGCACDVPSHAYDFDFAPNPFWPRFLSPAKDIWLYLDRVCKAFNLRQYMKFETAVTEARWDDEKSHWVISLLQTNKDGTKTAFTDTCDVFGYGPGLLNKPQWPKIDGLDKFKGRVVHTARWPEDYQEDQWKGQKVAVIGSGASSIQVVPKMQPHVGQMHVFVRTAVWFAASFIPEFPQDFAYSQNEIEDFCRDLTKLVEHKSIMERQLNGSWDMYLKGTPLQDIVKNTFTDRMKDLIKSPELIEGYLPKFSVGCRRITPGDPYLAAIQNPNVKVNFIGVEKLVEDGVVHTDGTFTEADTVICATGFDTSFTPRFPIIGKDGISLTEKWAKADPLAYLSVTVPDLPNFVLHGGPNIPIQNGSPMTVFNMSSMYLVHMINKIQQENLRCLSPKQHATEAFRHHAQEMIDLTVFADSCRSWYKNNDTGKISSAWPGSGLHFVEMLTNPRWEDYEIEYGDPKNMWAFMGLGFVRKHRQEGADLAWYLKPESIDARWVQEISLGLSEATTNGHACNGQLPLAIDIECRPQEAEKES